MNPPTLLGILGLAVAYFIAGQLGLLLAIPQGFASPVWPASGIALGFLLVFGYRLWPGVLLGSLFVEWSTHGDLSALSSDPASLILPVVIGCGAALQALLGALLVRRILGLPAPLDDARGVGAFLLLGGPLACLLNPTVGSTSLWLAGRLAGEAYSLAWATWWVGDTIGVLVFTPLVFIALAQPRDVWARRAYTVGLPLCVAFAMSVAVFHFAGDSERQRVKADFEQQAAIMAEAMRRTIDTNVEALASIVRFFDSSQKVERGEFASFVGRRVGPRHGIRALEWAPRVGDADRAAYEALARDEDFPVFFIEPLEGNEQAVGYDLASDPSRRAALDLARDSGEMVATGRITLVQETENRFGVLLVAPVYANGRSPDTVDGRRTASGQPDRRNRPLDGPIGGVGTESAF